MNERLYARQNTVRHAHSYGMTQWAAMLMNAYCWNDPHKTIDEGYVDGILWNIQLRIVGPRKRAAHAAMVAGHVSPSVSLGVSIWGHILRGMC
jgi:hypothetical protein